VAAALDGIGEPLGVVDPVVPAATTALQILGRRVLAPDPEKARIDALLAGL
jgi:hypothetical protein